MENNLVNKKQDSPIGFILFALSIFICLFMPIENIKLFGCKLDTIIITVLLCFLLYFIMMDLWDSGKCSNNAVLVSGILVLATIPIFGGITNWLGYKNENFYPVIIILFLTSINLMAIGAGYFGKKDKG